MATETLAAGRPGWWMRWREENASQLDEWRRGMYRFRQSRLSVIGLVAILFLVVVALTGPYWVPYPDDATGAVHAADRTKPPSVEHLFGTDEVGREKDVAVEHQDILVCGLQRHGDRVEVVQLSKQRVVDDLDPNVVPAMTHIPHYVIRAMARNEQQPIEPFFRQCVDASVEHARSIDAQFQWLVVRAAEELAGGNVVAIEPPEA